MSPRLLFAVSVLSILSGFATFAGETLEVRFSSAPLAYDPSAWELAPEFHQPKHPWTTDELRSEIRERVRREKERRELDIYYYRIGFTISYPLDMDHRLTTKEMPAPISTLSYPWMTWLSWAREERWRLLHVAWRQFDDREAGLLLQREMAALGRWDRFGECDGTIGLLTGHTAAVLALVLANPEGWQPEYLNQVRSAAEALIERDVWPWFQDRWREQTLSPQTLANIPVIALARSAQLARVIHSPHREAIESRTREVLSAWCRFRAGPEHHTEGVTYDGYLFETLTEWLEGLPDRDALLKECRDTFRSLADSWLALILPGRPDLHAPLADVEPEMTFWATALVRIAGWYQWPEAIWLVQQVPLARLRASGAIAALERPSLFTIRPAPPAVQPVELSYAVSLRTGWNEESLLAAVGLSRSVMSHLQADGGQFVFAWHGRCWIADPGYQQYRPGEERDYTLGVEAHNAPVIDGLAETERLARLEVLETDSAGRQHVRVDLTQCYRRLSAEASVSRDVWLLGQSGAVVRDSFKGLKQGVKVSNSWQGGNHFAWAFRRGWIRLSDGTRALWIGTSEGALQPASLHRHSGSRGPVTLTHTAALRQGEGDRWWIFVCDRTCGWESPVLTEKQGAIRVITSEGGSESWSFQ